MIGGISEHDFNQEITCTYKDEKYSVRDNGEVFRHPSGKRTRAKDCQWTFGAPNDKGYLCLASVPVHRITAFAFHGEPPSTQHVVDHIDTNKWNNRPENLRWVTKLENVLLNPITVKRITLVCGSVEAFLADPAQFRDQFQEPNYDWMCTVSKEEAQRSLTRMLAWANSDNASVGGALGQWIFSRGLLAAPPVVVREFSDLVQSKTLNAVQRDWRTPSEFPCCPQEFTGDPLIGYAANLQPESVFCRNDLYTNMVSQSAVADEGQSLIVITHAEDAVKQWALAKITFEDGLFVHASLGSFFAKEGVEKQFTLAQGLEWKGEDSIDDYC